MLDITNSSSETLKLGPKEALGILDLRCLGSTGSVTTKCK